MSEQTEQTPVAEAPQPVAVNPDVVEQVDLLKAKNAELIGERRKDQDRYKELQDQIAKLQQQNSRQKQQKLAESGEFKTLWEEAQRTVAERDAEIAQMSAQMNQQAAEAQQQQIRAQTVNTMSQLGVFAPDQLYQLMSQNLRVKDGSVVALHGGVEVGLQDHLSNLKNPGSGFEHFFRASGVAGMGTAQANPSVTSGMNNPYVTKNFTEIVALEGSDPAMAKRLRAEAASAN